MNLNSIASVSGLPEEETITLHRLLEIWSDKRARNALRYRYYLGKNHLKDFGISIPNTLRNVETVVGWGAKAVDALAVRSRFDGFITESDSVLSDIVVKNHLRTVYSQAVRSQLISSCSFLTVSAGGDGEPDVIISAYSALFGAAEWDRRKKRIKNGLTVIDTEKDPHSDNEKPIWVNLYSDTDTWEIKKDGTSWVARRVPHDMGRPLMEPLVFRPSLERPFGTSRINRAVMSIIDSAVREALRTEVGAEFYTSPQKYILGADESLFENKTHWDAYIGAILAITKDADGDVPTVGMFSQGSMQPHTDYMRSLAARFSGETSIPISELGVIHDNPASAEAIYAAKESLVCEAQELNEANGAALCEIGKMAIAIANQKGIEDLAEDERNISARFKNPAMPSVVSQADAITKIISALPWVSESDVPLEEYGFNSEQIRRLKSDKAKYEAKQQILLSMQNEQNNIKQPSMYEIASILKSYSTGKINKKNALLLFSKIGIDEQEALRMFADADDVAETAEGAETFEEEVVETLEGSENE